MTETPDGYGFCHVCGGDAEGDTRLMCPPCQQRQDFTEIHPGHNITTIMQFEIAAAQMFANNTPASHASRAAAKRCSDIYNSALWNFRQEATPANAKTLHRAVEIMRNAGLRNA